MPGTRAAYRMSHAPPGVGRRSKEHPDDVVCEHRGAVFEAHGKRLEYAKNSLYLFDEHNRFRIICANIVSHPFFDRVILLFILLNSIVLALTDWSVIDEDPNSEDVGEPVVEGSWRNTLLYESEIVFTVCFTTEFVLKVIAQGFFLGQGSYLRDPWNDLDFVVVVTALLTSIPNMPKMTAIRVFRVLRPLRSVSALPGLQKLVVSMLRSVPQLVSVVILLQFIFTVFGIFGIQIFAGKQHSRCRLTPHPVTTDFEIGMNHTDYRCINAINFDTVDDEPDWLKKDSPWATARECWWPLDLEDDRLCAFDSASGKHKCDHDPMYMEESEFRWCGSNYDALGNRRFSGGVIEGVLWGPEELTENATFVESLNWGYTTFDNIFVAFLSIFQSITLEGWSEILYQVKDCSLPILGDLFFIILVLWGSFFTLNLLLAVLEVNFSQGKEDDKEAEDERQRQALIEAEGVVTNGEPLVDDNGGANAEEKDEKDEEGGNALEASETLGYPAWRLALYRLVMNETFQQSITALIVTNTVVLALDHHPMDDEFSTYVEALNFSFTLSFVLEMALKLVALGPRGYAKDRFNLFDGFIVLSSIVELIVSPPDILTGASGGSTGGGLSALRSFRVFRIFKLARDWHSMRELLETLRKTLLDIGNFGLLLLLFMYIYVLIGLQFFANRFHFDDDGHSVGIGEEGYNTAEVPRSNFDTLLNAFVTVFEILSGENWNAVMYNARRATSWVSVFYFISLIVMGMMIVMSLFLAILLSNFNTEDEADEHAERALDDTADGNGAITRLPEAGRDPVEEEEEEEEPMGDAKMEDADDNLGHGKSADNGTAQPLSPQRAPSHRGPSRKQPSSQGQSIKTMYDSESGSGRGEKGNGVDKIPPARGHSGSVDSSGSKDVAVGKVGEGLVVRVRRKLGKIGEEVGEYCVESIKSVRVPDNIHPGKALFILGPKNPIRRRCSAVVTNPGFDRFTLVLIGLSSLALALDNPLRDPDAPLSLLLNRAEVVLTVLFSLEMVLKVLAHGFLFMPGAYLKSSWNILDFLVVVVSVFQLTADDAGGLSGLRSLRALRALRPLRLINRMPGLKLVLEALIASIPGVLNVAAVCLMFFVIFAILGVNYFKGILMSCQGEGYDALPQSVTSFVEEPLAWSSMSAEQQAWFGPLSNVSDAFSVDGGGDFISAGDCTAINDGWPDSSACCSAWPASATEAPTSFQVCECLGLEWDQTIPQQFDNVAVALLTFFEISTTEAWTAVTYAAVDATEEDMQPIRDKHLVRVWFFILFMLFGAYLVMNLFVGVVVDNFKKMKSKVEGEGVLVTEAQQSWIKTQIVLRRLRPLKREKPPGHPLGDWCFRLANRGWFDVVVMTCIVLNTIVMAMEYFGQSDIYTTILAGANYAFFGVFTIEAAIKILAFRKAYFSDPWNRFDFVIVIGSFLGLLMLWTVGSSYGSIATVIRVFRIGRVLRLVRGLESMAQLFNTLLLTLPSLGNVGALLCLLFFIYAAMGVQLFAKVGLSGAVSEQANFQSFWDSMVLLLRFSTGENWNGFMYDLNADREGCDSSPSYNPNVCGFTDRANCTPLNGCGTWAIFPYMISFTLAVTFVFMNLFIGVILDGFDAASSGSTDVITQDDFARFAERWADYDPHATCLITVQDLYAFLQTLYAPWGFGSEHIASKREMRNKVRRLHLQIFEGNRVHFKDVLLALSEEVYRTDAEEKGATIDLPKSYHAELAIAWQKQSGRGSNFVYMVNPVSNETVTLAHVVAVEFIQQAIRGHLERRKSDREESQNREPDGEKRPSTPLADIVATEPDSLDATPPNAAGATKSIALEVEGGEPLESTAELPRPVVQSAGKCLVAVTNGGGGGGGGVGGGGHDLAPSSDPVRGVERGGSASLPTEGVDRELGSKPMAFSKKWTVAETATSDARPDRMKIMSPYSSFGALRSSLTSPGSVMEQQPSVRRGGVGTTAGGTAGVEPGRRVLLSGTLPAVSGISSLDSPRERSATALVEGRSEIESPREELDDAESGALPSHSSRQWDDSGGNRH